MAIGLTYRSEVPGLGQEGYEDYEGKVAECVPPIGYVPPAPVSGGPGPEPEVRQRARRRLAAAVVVALAVVLAVAAGAVARYVTVQDRAAEMVASGFHMSSDTLQEVASGGTAPSYAAFCDADGTFAVNLYNWEVGNVDSVSGVEITYSVIVGNGTLLSVDTGGSGSAPVGGPYLLGKGAKGTHVLHVKPDEDAARVTVRVEATAPYEKALEASFDVSPLAGAGVSANLVQSGLTVSTGSSDTGAAVVSVQTNQFEGDLVLKWESGLTPAAGVAEGPGGWGVDYGNREARAGDVRRLETYRFEFVGAAPGAVAVEVDEAAGAATVIVRAAAAG